MHVTLFTKPDCHLCELVKLELAALQEEFAFEYVERNILEDEELWQSYRLRIPVVEIGAKESATQPIQLAAPINQIVLRQQIKAAAQKAPRS